IASVPSKLLSASNTLSAPGSFCNAASTAEASSTTLSTFCLALCFEAAFCNQLFRKAAIRADVFPDGCLCTLDRLLLALNMQTVIIHPNRHHFASFESHRLPVCG